MNGLCRLDLVRSPLGIPRRSDRHMIRKLTKHLLRAAALSGAVCLVSVHCAGIRGVAVAEPAEPVFQGTLVETFMAGKPPDTTSPSDFGESATGAGLGPAESGACGTDAQGSDAAPGRPAIPDQTESWRNQAGASNQEEKEDGQPATGETEAQTASEVGTSQPAATPDRSKSVPQEGTADLPTLLKEAQELLDKGEHSSALAIFERVIDGTKREKDGKITAAARHGAAQALHALGKPNEALEHVQLAIVLNQQLKNARARSRDYLLAGSIYMSLSKPDIALQSFEEAQKILPVSESAVLPGLLEKKGLCYLSLLRYGDALKELTRAHSAAVKEGNQTEAARLSVSIGELLVARSDYRAALSHFTKAKEVYKSEHRQRELGETLYRIAYVSQMLGDLKAADQCAEEGQALLTENGQVGGGALPLLVRGMRAYREGRMNQASRDLTAALRLCEKTGDRMMQARIRLSLAEVQLDSSRSGSALELAGKSLADFRSLSAIGGEAYALHFIGKVYYRQGFVQKALEYAEEAVSLGKRIGDRDNATQACILLADIHEGLGDSAAAGKMLYQAVDYAKAGVNAQARADLGLALARYRVARNHLDKALQAIEEARKSYVEIHDRRGLADCDHMLGVVYELRGERDKAMAALTSALEGHRATWDRYGEGKDLTALGVHFKNQGQPDQALDHFRRAMDLRQGIGDQRGYAANLANVGNILRHQNDMPEALKHLQKALAIYQQLGDRKGEADVLTNIGNLEAARGLLSSALDNFSQALSIHREIRDVRGIGTDLTSIGRVYLTKGDVESAAKHLEEAQKILASVHDPRSEAALLADLAMLQRMRRNTSGALSLLAKARQLAESTGDASAASAIDLKMASVYEDMQEYDKALKLLRSTLDTARKQQDRQKELWALGEIGIIQVKTEDYENALKSLHAAKTLATDLGIPASKSKELDFYLGEIYDGFRDYDRALDHYHRALGLYQVPGQDEVLGQLYDKIGNIYYRMEEFAKAKTFFEDAVRISGEIRNTSMQIAQLIRLGDIASKLNNSEEALRYQQRALTLTKESGDQRTQARILTRVGTLYQMLGRPKTALETYREAWEIRTRLGDSRGVSENLLQIALVTSILGDSSRAVADLKRAFEIAQCSEDRSMLWKAYFIMGRTLEGDKRPGEALESYRKAITILEAMEAEIMEESEEDDFIFGGKTALFETTLRVLMGLARKDPEGAYDSQALRIVEKLKAAEFENALSRINVENFSNLPRELLIKEKSLKLGLRKLNARLAQARAALNPDKEELQKLLAERRAKEKRFLELKERLLKEYPAYADLWYPRPVSVHRVQREAIMNEEAILEFMVTRSRTYLFAIDKGRFHTFSIDYPGNELEKDIEALTRPLYRADTLANWDPSAAYRLYAKMIKPAEYFLAGKRSIQIIPHGPLCALPFEILVNSDAHANRRFWSAKDRPSYLLEKYTFCYAPSLSVLSHVRTRKRSRKPGWNMVAFGDPVYEEGEKAGERNPGADRLITTMQAGTHGSRGSQLRPLPGTRKEISEILSIVGGPTQTYLGPLASETLFKKADLGRYNYIHLATHGVLLGGSGKFPQQPAIVFSLFGDKENDGFLQLGEVFGLQLNADLVALSSCLTPGTIRPNETNALMGLARAFLFAGTDSVILSMWQVNDESTSRFFVDVYRSMEHETKAEALRKAKVAMLNNQASSHPYYWAPFILVGNWHNTFDRATNRTNPDGMQFKGISSWRKWLRM